MFAGWFLDKILIQRHPTRESEKIGGKKKKKAKPVEPERNSRQKGRSRVGALSKGALSDRYKMISKANLILELRCLFY